MSDEAPTHSRRALLVGAGAALAGAGCGRWRRGSQLAVALLVPKTGNRAPWGEDLLHGVELALEQQNLRGGVNGRRLRLVALDTESREERAATLTARAVERESPLCVFGEVSSVANERGAAAAQRRGAVFVATASTARDVSRVGDFVFRTAVTDAEQAQAIARYARTGLQKRRAAVIYRRRSLLHVSMADAFQTAFRANGGELALRDSYTDDTELVRLAARLRSSGADVVYAPAATEDAGRLAVALRQGRNPVQIVGGDGWASPEVRRYAQDALTGVLYTDAFCATAQRPEVEAFVAAFRERHRASPGTFAALGYDALRWVVQAATRLPQTDARLLRDALLNTSLRDAVANPFTVDARRSLSRPVCVMRWEGDGPVLAATQSA